MARLTIELWTRRARANHVRKMAAAAGHPALAKAGNVTVHLVFRQVMLAPVVGMKAKDGRVIYTVTVDEEPGVQALAATAPDLPPVSDEHPTLARDYEYERLGTASILASLDLQDGHVTARVERKHRSREFIQLLEDPDAYYPGEAVIRLILDNHPAHISKESQAPLAHSSTAVPKARIRTSRWNERR